MQHSLGLGGEVTTLSAEILRLDQMLRRYGSAADPARETLRQYAEHKSADLFPDAPLDVHLGNPSTYELLQRLEDMLLALKPANSRDQWWLGQAMTLAAKIGDARWLIAQQTGQGTPRAFVGLLVFWLVFLFASFGLFAPRNLTSAVVLTLCALAVAGAVAMFLELERASDISSVSRRSQCDRRLGHCKSSTKSVLRAYLDGAPPRKVTVRLPHTIPAVKRIATSQERTPGSRWRGIARGF
jgi:hypothetical protein